MKKIIIILVYLCGSLYYTEAQSYRKTENRFPLPVLGSPLELPGLKPFPMDFFVHFQMPVAPDILKEKYKLHKPDFIPHTVSFTQQSFAFTKSPLYHPYGYMLNRFPFQQDYNRSQSFSLPYHLLFRTKGERKIYIGLGGYETFGGEIDWQPKGDWIVQAGMSLIKQSTPLSISPTNLTGISFLLRHHLTDKISFTAWGNYIYAFNRVDRSNPFSYGNPLFPHTGMGVNLEMKFNEHVGMKVGAEYQMNTYNKAFSKGGFLFKHSFFYGF
ncbi:hypothetical protein [Parabacteroides pacaensis]|uniref:hypothetical protein n=1 Tax=Parabacteroides pacaensis TaxID=2086575 RepID=UPI000D110453|nr:hypothetical protein [Parabacteroides pacaensis]